MIAISIFRCWQHRSVYGVCVNTVRRERQEQTIIIRLVRRDFHRWDTRSPTTALQITQQNRCLWKQAVESSTKRKNDDNKSGQIRSKMNVLQENARGKLE